MKPDIVVDWSELDWLPEERRAARHIIMRKGRKKFGDLMLPENCQIVSAKDFSKLFAIVGPPYRPKPK